MPSPDQVTALLQDWSDGDEGAFEALVPLAKAWLSREMTTDAVR